MGDEIVRLEEKLAFVERHVEELDAVVRELYDRVDAVRENVARLRQDTHQQLEEITRTPEDDVPPHSGRR